MERQSFASLEPQIKRHLDLIEFSWQSPKGQDYELFIGVATTQRQFEMMCMQLALLDGSYPAMEIDFENPLKINPLSRGVPREFSKPVCIISGTGNLGFYNELKPGTSNSKMLYAARSIADEEVMIQIGHKCAQDEEVVSSLHEHDGWEAQFSVFGRLQIDTKEKTEILDRNHPTLFLPEGVRHQVRPIGTEPSISIIAKNFNTHIHHPSFN